MKLIVGLGNPGKQYQGTRHNVGWVVLALLAKNFATGSPRGQFQGETSEAMIRGEKALLLTPLTYMNLSGASVLAARDFYKIDHQDLLIVCDDFNLPLAKLRFRASGSSGGQKGLEDVIRRLGTDSIPRLRIGIGQPPPGRDVPGYVLGRFTPEEQAEMTLATERAAAGVADWVERGLQHCMNQYNA
ncbi:MAG: aminoacyl-tRNA hydrolase [Pirellulaceae bacterium]|nr:aminoacyl-tRNA hydrolase [Pirellulaceae bacterium]